MLRGGRAHRFEQIGRRRHDRHSALPDQSRRHRMFRHSDRGCRQPRTGQIHARILPPALQNHGKRSRPETPCQRQRPLVGQGIVRQRVKIGDVGNQRIKSRTSFNRKNLCHRFGVIHVGAETVHGFGRHGGQTAVFNHFCRFGNIFFVCLIYVAHQLSSRKKYYDRS